MQWSQGVNAICRENLDRPLLIRNPQTNLVTLNFSPQLVAVLKEVHYLNQRKYGQEEHPVPDSAVNMYTENETFLKYVHNLTLIQDLYNKVRETILDVEYPLIEQELRGIDDKLNKAINDINWTSDGIWEYIQGTRDQVVDLERRVRLAKLNVEQISNEMAKWSESPFYSRKDGKDANLFYPEVTRCLNN